MTYIRLVKSFLVMLFFLSTPMIANAEFVRGGWFGPDANHKMNSDHIGIISVPPGGKLTFNVSFNAAHENVVIIYEEIAGNIIERCRNGNQSHKFCKTPYIVENKGVALRQFAVSAWNKKGSAASSGNKKWRQSLMKPSINDNLDEFKFSFEDYPEGNMGYGNAIVTVVTE